MNKKVLILFVFFLSFSFVQGQSKKEKKKAIKEEGYQKVKEFVTSQKIDFTANWALALKGKRVNINGNADYLKIKGDSVFVSLPYFGVRTGGNSYTGDGGIKIQNLLKDLEIEFKDDKQRVQLKFSASDSSESIEFFMTIYSNGKTDIKAYSNSRSAISYDGTAVELIDQED